MCHVRSRFDNQATSRCQAGAKQSIPDCTITQSVSCEVTRAKCKQPLQTCSHLAHCTHHSVSAKCKQSCWQLILQLCLIAEQPLHAALFPFPAGDGPLQETCAHKRARARRETSLTHTTHSHRPPSISQWRSNCHASLQHIAASPHACTRPRTPTPMLRSGPRTPSPEATPQPQARASASCVRLSLMRAPQPQARTAAPLPASSSMECMSRMS